MGQDRDVATEKNTKKEISEPSGRNVVRGFDQNVVGLSNRKQAALLQSCDEVGYDVVVGSRNKPQRNRSIIEPSLKLRNGGLYLRT